MCLLCLSADSVLCLCDSADIHPQLRAGQRQRQQHLRRSQAGCCLTYFSSWAPGRPFGSGGCSYVSSCYEPLGSCTPNQHAFQSCPEPSTVWGKPNVAKEPFFLAFLVLKGQLEFFWFLFLNLGSEISFVKVSSLGYLFKEDVHVYSGPQHSAACPGISANQGYPSFWKGVGRKKMETELAQLFVFQIYSVLVPWSP